MEVLLFCSSFLYKEQYCLNNDQLFRLRQLSQSVSFVQYTETIQSIGKLTNKPHTSHQNMSQLKWELANQSGIISSNSNFNIDLITLDCVAGSAMVIPCFSFLENVKNKHVKVRKLDTPITGKPVISDVFWYVDRMFFDGSGWEELEIHNSTSNSDTNEINVNNIQSFINKNCIQPAEEIKEADFPELYEDEMNDIGSILDNEHDEDY